MAKVQLGVMRVTAKTGSAGDGTDTDTVQPILGGEAACNTYAECNLKLALHVYRARHILVRLSLWRRLARGV